MQVIINKSEKEVKAASIAEMLAELDLSTHGLAVAVEGNVVPKRDWEETKLIEGSQITLIKATQGG